jgi:hypothetical protein
MCAKIVLGNVFQPCYPQQYEHHGRILWTRYRPDTDNHNSVETDKRRSFGRLVVISDIHSLGKALQAHEGGGIVLEK